MTKIPFSTHPQTLFGYAFFINIFVTMKFECVVKVKKHTFLTTETYSITTNTKSISD
jgi:hypothetical protein